MIFGIGVDVVEIERFAATMQRTPGVAQRVLTTAELEMPTESQAVRFAAKEALAKAIGKNSMNWQDVRVINDEDGQPHFEFSAAGEAVLLKNNIKNVHISLSHDAGVATAFVIAES